VGLTGRPKGPAYIAEHSPDTGCEFSPSCLRCPLPLCKDDMEPIELHRLRTELKVRHLKAVTA